MHVKLYTLGVIELEPSREVGKENGGKGNMSHKMSQELVWYLKNGH